MLGPRAAWLSLYGDYKVLTSSPPASSSPNTFGYESKRKPSVNLTSTMIGLRGKY